ncbi:hypothetical protein ABBQ32_006951 [Trebouxia sp. C0010 RCD-2024]
MHAHALVVQCRHTFPGQDPVGQRPRRQLHLCCTCKQDNEKAQFAQQTLHTVGKARQRSASRFLASSREEYRETAFPSQALFAEALKTNFPNKCGRSMPLHERQTAVQCCISKH